MSDTADVEHRMEFVPVVTFHDDDLASDYVAGLVYNGHNNMAKKIDKWIAEGKVIATTSANVPRMRGIGKIK